MMFLWNCVLKLVGLFFPHGWTGESDAQKIKAQEDLELTKRGFPSPRELMRYTVVLYFWLLVVVALLSPFIPELKSMPQTYTKLILGAITGLLD